MAEPFTSKKWGLWVQPDGPNTTMYYLGCHTLDDVATAGGGIKDLIRCFKSDGTGWTTLGSTRNPPDPVTTTVTGLIEATADWLERILEDANCPFPLYISGKLCPPYDVFGGAARWYALEQAEIGATTLVGLSHREEDNISEQSFEISAWPTLLRGRAIATDRIAMIATADENLNDIASCSVPRCAGDCGEAVKACDMLVAVADAVAPSADVWFSFDHGVNWIAGIVDPYLGPATDLKSVVCYPIDSDTTRVVVAREAVGGMPNHVYYSDDSGGNWTDVNLGGTHALGATYGTSMFALDMYHTWLVTTDGAGVSEVWFSDDGAETWTEQVVPAGTFHGIWFADEDIGMIVGAADTVITTTDGGLTWDAATATGGADTNYCAAESAGGDIWWIGTNAGELWYSSDHGVVWAQRAFPGDGAGAVYSLEFVTETVGFMVHSPTADTGRLYRTRNGGLTWELESATYDGELYSVIGCSINEAFAVGEVDTTALVLRAHD